MVLMPTNMDQIKGNRERRTSSPIGIPNAKVLASVATRATADTLEESPDSASQSWSPNANYKSANSASLPVHLAGGRLHRILSEETPAINPQSGDSPGSDGFYERVPLGSPAFSAVFNQLNEAHEEKKSDSEKVHTQLESTHHEENVAHLEKNSPKGTPLRTRKDLKNLKFAVESMNIRSGPSHFRPRAASASTQRKAKPKIDIPSSTHSTPALHRRKKGANVENARQIVNLVPKYKFLTETVTVSHEDLMREQEREERMRNGFSSPKSIFGTLEPKVFSS